MKKSIIYNYAEDYCDFATADGIKNRVGYEFISKINDYVPVLRLDQLICDDQTCDALRDGTIMYRDEGHLSKEGAQLLGKEYDLKKLAIELAS